MVTPEGRPIESSGFIYHCSIVSCEIIGEIDDGIFEPGERITVRNIVVANSGGLTLPAGAELRFHSQDASIHVDTAVAVLPLPLAPGNFPNQCNPDQRVTMFFCRSFLHGSGHFIRLHTRRTVSLSSKRPLHRSCQDRWECLHANAAIPWKQPSYGCNRSVCLRPNSLSHDLHSY